MLELLKKALERSIAPKVNYSKASWAVLAALRFVLALVVFDSHLIGFGIPAALPALYPIGRTCVLGFFLISGVSIGYSYRQRSEGFYTRRFLRIYPLYFAAIIFTEAVVRLTAPGVIFPSLSFGHSAGLATTAANLCFLQGFAAIPLPYDGALWSLSLEAWLYALTPVFFRLPRWALLALTSASLAAFAKAQGEMPSSFFGVGLLVYGWPWWIGFLLACDQRKRAPLVLGSIGVGLFFVDHLMLATENAACALLFASVLVTILLVGRARLPQRLATTANVLGDVSYPLYLFHMPMTILLFGRLGVHSEIGLITVALAFVVALVVFYEGQFKRIFWKPLTCALVRRLPSSWTLFRRDAGRNVAPVAPDTAPVPVP